MDNRTKNIIGVWFVAALVAFILALLPTCSRAATLDIGTTLHAWSDANEHCRGDHIPESYMDSPTFPDNYPACARRKVLAQQLERAGLRQGYEDTWYIKTR